MLEIQESTPVASNTVWRKKMTEIIFSFGMILGVFVAICAPGPYDLPGFAWRVLGGICVFLVMAVISVPLIFLTSSSRVKRVNSLAVSMGVGDDRLGIVGGGLHRVVELSQCVWRERVVGETPFGADALPPGSEPEILIEIAAHTNLHIEHEEINHSPAVVAVGFTPESAEQWRKILITHEVEQLPTPEIRPSIRPLSTYLHALLVLFAFPAIFAIGTALITATEFLFHVIGVPEQIGIAVAFLTLFHSIYFGILYVIALPSKEVGSIRIINYGPSRKLSLLIPFCVTWGLMTNVFVVSLILGEEASTLFRIIAFVLSTVLIEPLCLFFGKDLARRMALPHTLQQDPLKAFQSDASENA
jgi:hypothetical protein